MSELYGRQYMKCIHLLRTHTVPCLQRVCSAGSTLLTQYVSSVLTSDDVVYESSDDLISEWVF
jgi:hypothetical protein